MVLGPAKADRGQRLGAARTTFHVENSVVFKRFDRNDPEGGSPCNPGQGTDYNWSVMATRLTLQPVNGKDPCAPTRVPLDRRMDATRLT